MKPTKYIFYILVSREGTIETKKHICQQNEPDDTNIWLFAPENLKGDISIWFKEQIARGFKLSNWHVIEQ